MQPVKNERPGVMTYTCNPSTLKAESGKSRVQSSPGIHSKLCSHLDEQTKLETKEKASALFFIPTFLLSSVLSF